VDILFAIQAGGAPIMPYTLSMALLVRHSYEFFTGGAGKPLLRARRGSLVRHWLGNVDEDIENWMY
jgi:hypothetical protein